MNEILLNIYAQNKISRLKIEKIYENLDENEKITFLSDIIFLILASNANEQQLDLALKNSGYRNTINYYNMLKSKKNVFRNNISKIKELKGTPFKQGLTLLLELFRIAQQEKKKKCLKYDEKCSHWWHLDLSNTDILNKILNKNFHKSQEESQEIIKKIERMLME